MASASPSVLSCKSALPPPAPDSSKPGPSCAVGRLNFGFLNGGLKSSSSLCARAKCVCSMSCSPSCYKLGGALCSVSPGSRANTSAAIQQLVSLPQRSVTRPWPHRLRFCRPCPAVGEEKGNSPSNEGAILDEEALQQDLERAIAEENYSLAAKLRDDIRLLQDDNKASILAANSRFYDAFRSGDFVAMRSIWAKGDHVCCVHPGAGAITGYDLVMGSWEIICGADYEFPIMIDLRNVDVHARGDVGYVTCLEVVKTKGNSWGRQVATNVFERVDGQWLLCVHHASHVDS